MKKAIITGANGFIGRNFIKELLKHDVEVLALDRNKKEIDDNLIEDNRIKRITLDLERIEELKEKVEYEEYDIFYHFAWAGSAGEQRADTILQLKNAQWTVNCLQIAKQIGCKRFVGAGSIMELETIEAAYTPTNRPGVGYIYGSGKIAAHTMAKSVAADIGIDFLWAEITNAYGEGEISKRFINTTIRKILENEPLQFTAATQNYDFVHIADVVTAFYLIGEKGIPFSEYLIGSSNARPLKEFIIELINTLAPEKKAVFGSIPFTGINLTLDKFDCSRTKKDTGFYAKISFSEGVKRVMNWMMEEKNNGSTILF